MVLGRFLGNESVFVYFYNGFVCMLMNYFSMNLYFEA